MQHRVDRRCLAGSGTARHDEEPVFDRADDCVQLLFRELDGARLRDPRKPDLYVLLILAEFHVEVDELPF